MKKIIFISLTIILFASCDAKISDAVYVEQINITNSKDYKYEVKLHTLEGEAFYYTNVRYQVGDTLDAYRSFFDEKNPGSNTVVRERDSLKKELITTKYYLEILKERVFVDTLKRK